MESICDQLFQYYRYNDARLRQFVLFYLPSLIGLHLAKFNASVVERRTYQCIDVLLLCIYNLEVVDEDGNPVKQTFRFPVLSKPSVYHEPSLAVTHQVGQTALTENALHRLETNGGSGDLIVTSFGPYRDFEQIVSLNRWKVLTVLLKVFNKSVCLMPKQSLRVLCNQCCR